MGDESWYYLDRDARRQGPLPRAGIVEALRRGNLPADGKVQRDGETAWLPLSWADFPTGDQPPTRSPPTPVAATVERKPRHARDVVYASLLRRGAARFIDMLVLGTPFVLFAVLRLIPADRAPNMHPMRIVIDLGALALLYALVASPIYQVAFLGSEAQATPGRRALGIKVTDLDGGQIGFGRALRRCLARIVTWLTLGVGFFVVPFTARRQAMHDLLADTLVVDRWAFTDSPQLQLRAPPPLQMAFVALLVVVAIASPKLYGLASDSQQALFARSQVFTAWAEVGNEQLAVAEYYSNLGTFPPDSAAAGVVAREIPHNHPIGTVAIDHGSVVVLFDDRAAPRLRGRRLVLRPTALAESTHWTCGSDAGTTLEVEDQPALCQH